MGLALMFIRSLTLSNILSFHNPGPLALRPLNVFIGANASGKSNLIDCIGLLRALPSNISGYINDRGGAESWVWGGPWGSTGMPAIHSEFELTQETLTYKLTFAPVERTFAIQTESLFRSDYTYLNRSAGRLEIGHGGLPGLQDMITSVSPAESSLSAYRFPSSPITQAANAFSDIRIYRDFRTGTRDDARIGVASVGPKQPLEEDGSNLALTLQELDFHGVLPTVKDYLRRLSDRFEDVKLRAEGGRFQMYVQERGLGRISATRLSDGTLRFLCLMAVLFDPNPAPMVCLEEPEAGLHPDALALVGDALRDAATRTQLIVTTHSDALVDRFTDEPENVIVCERDFDESTCFRRLSSEKLSEWLEEYTLGEVWRRGEIGGTKR
jgi:predicted ATPase